VPELERNHSSLQWASCMRPMPPERVGGDRALCFSLAEGVLLVIVDVLGHGPEADAVAEQMEGFVEKRRTSQITRLMQAVHEDLRGTRGAAAGFCWVDAASGEARYLGTGNTSFRRIGEDDATSLVSRDGVLGQRMHGPFEQKLALQPRDVLLLCTDGVRTFAPADYLSLREDPIENVAQQVVQRFGRSHDDAACIALRYEP